MDLSLRGLKEYLIAKQGYSITPGHSQLNDLRDLINDMYRVRSENTCPAHSGTSYTGYLSLGDIYAAAQQLYPCACYSQKVTVCDCRSRTGGDSCSCDLRTATCDCRNRTSVDNCTCDGRGTGCDCRLRRYSCAYYGTCDSYWWCGEYSREDDGPIDGCLCVDRSIHDSCYAYIVTEACACETRGVCSCVNRVGEPNCDCDTRGVCNCQNRTPANICLCDGRCSCNVENRFE